MSHEKEPGTGGYGAGCLLLLAAAIVILAGLAGVALL